MQLPHTWPCSDTGQRRPAFEWSYRYCTNSSPCMWIPLFSITNTVEGSGEKRRSGSEDRGGEMGSGEGEIEEIEEIKETEEIKERRRA